MVYKLYGLPAAEIAIVKGHSKSDRRSNILSLGLKFSLSATK
jgi:hypothetical protein